MERLENALSDNQTPISDEELEEMEYERLQRKAFQ
jgi:hypothetical protein